MSAFTLVGRTVLVTGAGRGIGEALVRQLAAKGASRVIMVGRDRRRLEEVHARFPLAEPYEADLSDEAQLDALIAFVKANAPDLSVLINNAGTQLLTDLVNPESDRHRHALAKEVAVNFSAPVQLSIALLPHLLTQRSAMIVNVTSGLALAPKQSSPVYCGTKAGLRNFTKALRYQAQARAPHVKIVEALPPLVDTDMTRGRGRAKISPDACAADHHRHRGRPRYNLRR